MNGKRYIENSVTGNNTRVSQGKAIFSINTLSTTAKIILFLLICTGTASSVVFVGRYQNISGQLLLNADFTKKLNSWQTSRPPSGEIVVRNSQLILSSHDAEKSIEVSQKVQADVKGKKIRLRATLVSKNVIPGEKTWNKARLLLVQYFDGKPQWRFPHVLAALTGTHDRQVYNEVFSISPECSELRVVAEMSRCSGEFFIKNLGLYEVEETTIYTWVKWLVRAAWILFIFVLFVPVLKGSGSTLLKTFIVLTVLGVVIGTNLPGKVKKELKEDITQKIETYTAPVMTKTKEYAVNTTQYAIVKLDITKIAHFCLFALLALLLLLKDSSRSIRLTLLELFMLACATECMQFYIDGRSPLVTDVVIDMAGGVAGMVAGKYLFNGRLTAH